MKGNFVHARLLTVRNRKTLNNLGPHEPTNTGIPSSSTSTLIIVVISVAGIILIGSAIAGIFIYKKRQEHFHPIATPG
ncbi:14121_t:CDS:2, partial [Gigaspora margarita]